MCLLRTPFWPRGSCPRCLCKAGVAFLDATPLHRGVWVLHAQGVSLRTAALYRTNSTLGILPIETRSSRALNTVTKQ